MIFNAMQCDECHKITPIDHKNWYIKVTVEVGAHMDPSDAGLKRALSLAGHYCSTSCVKAKLDKLERNGFG